MNRRRRITFEIEQHLVVRRTAGKRAKSFCAFCQRDVEMLTPAEASLIAEGSGQAISDLICLGRLHITDAGNDLRLICCASLKQSLGEFPPPEKRIGE